MSGVSSELLPLPPVYSPVSNKQVPAEQSIHVCCWKQCSRAGGKSWGWVCCHGRGEEEGLEGEHGGQKVKTSSGSCWMKGR